MRWGTRHRRMSRRWCQKYLKSPCRVSDQCRDRQPGLQRAAALARLSVCVSAFICLVIIWRGKKFFFLGLDCQKTASNIPDDVLQTSFGPINRWRSISRRRWGKKEPEKREKEEKQSSETTLFGTQPGARGDEETLPGAGQP